MCVRTHAELSVYVVTYAQRRVIKCTHTYTRTHTVFTTTYLIYKKLHKISVIKSLYVLHKS